MSTGRWLFKRVDSAGLHVDGNSRNAVNATNQKGIQKIVKTATGFPSEAAQIAELMKTYVDIKISPADFITYHYILSYHSLISDLSTMRDAAQIQNPGIDLARIIALEGCNSIGSLDCERDERYIDLLIPSIKAAVVRFISQPPFNLSLNEIQAVPNRHILQFVTITSSLTCLVPGEPLQGERLREVERQSGCSVKATAYRIGHQNAHISIIGPKNRLLEAKRLLVTDDNNLPTEKTCQQSQKKPGSRKEMWRPSLLQPFSTAPPPQGYQQPPPSQYPPQGYPPQGYPPQQGYGGPPPPAQGYRQGGGPHGGYTQGRPPPSPQQQEGYAPQGQYNQGYPPPQQPPYEAPSHSPYPQQQAYPPNAQQPYGAPPHSPNPQQQGYPPSQQPSYKPPPPQGQYPPQQYGAPPSNQQYGQPPPPQQGNYGAPPQALPYGAPPPQSYGNPQAAPTPPSPGYVPGQVAHVDMSRQADECRKAMKGFGTA